MHSKQNLLLVVSLLIFACSPPQKTTTLEFNEASVSTISNSIKMTPLEQEAIVAKSKTLTPINAIELTEIIKTAAGRMHLFSFWTKDCRSCLEQLKQLENFATKKGAYAHQLVFVNLDTDVEVKELKDALEKYQINTKSFWLKNEQHKEWQTLLPKNLIDNQPYLLMVKNDENRLMSYQQAFSPNELFNLLYPFPTADGALIVQHH